MANGAPVWQRCTAPDCHLTLPLQAFGFSYTGDLIPPETLPPPAGRGELLEVWTPDFVSGGKGEGSSLWQLAAAGLSACRRRQPQRRLSVPPRLPRLSVQAAWKHLL